MSRQNGYYADSWAIDEFGLERAILLNRLIYWHHYAENKQEKECFRDGLYWFYHEYKTWQEEIFFCKQRTLERHLAYFKEKGILVVTNDDSFVRKNYYRVNFDAHPKLKAHNDLTQPKVKKTNNDATRQNGGLEPAKMAGCQPAKMAGCLTKDSDQDNTNTISVKPSSKAPPASLTKTKKSEIPIENHPLWQLYAQLVKEVHGTAPPKPDGKVAGQCAQFARRFKEEAEPFLRSIFDERYDFFGIHAASIRKRVPFDHIGRKLGKSKHSWSVIMFNIDELWHEWEKDKEHSEYADQA